MDNETVYLPGKIRDRIQDLMKSRKVTQAELAAKIGCSESALSRFISGKTDKLGDESIIRIARVFEVSTDFLLGEVDEPDRKNYDISELGLSVEAARNLYTQKVNPKIVSYLLENPQFADTTYQIARYLDNELTAGFAAQNQLYSMVSSMLGTVPQAAGRGRGQKSADAYRSGGFELHSELLYEGCPRREKGSRGGDASHPPAYGAGDEEHLCGTDQRRPKTEPENYEGAGCGRGSGLRFPSARR